jgi:hypothetical protein
MYVLIRQAYPSWMILALYNRIGLGDFVSVNEVSSPSHDIPATVAGPYIANASMVAVYATRNADQLVVFVLSRKIDNFTSASDDGYASVLLNLPITAASSITLYSMTGNPRSHNLDFKNISIVQSNISKSLFSQHFRIDSLRGVDDRGLPPSATLVYVFGGVTYENVVWPRATVSLCANQTASITYPSMKIYFCIYFDQAVSGLGDQASDFVISGTAVGATVTYVSPLYGSGGTAYVAQITNMIRQGTVKLAIAQGAVALATDTTVLNEPSPASPAVAFWVSALVPERPAMKATDLGQGAVLLTWNASRDPAKLYDNFTVCGSYTSGFCNISITGLTNFSLQLSGVLLPSKVGNCTRVCCANLALDILCVSHCLQSRWLYVVLRAHSAELC